jgi:hypothetical protein
MNKLLIIDDREVVPDGVKRIFDEPRCRPLNSFATGTNHGIRPSSRC